MTVTKTLMPYEEQEFAVAGQRFDRQSKGGKDSSGRQMAPTHSKADRNFGLDFTKGALVLIMVLYHWINYFLVGIDNRYLRFLTPSFIFITGFLISNVYCSKYGTSNPRLPRRLVARGLKILAVFAVLNLLRYFAISKSAPGPFPSSLPTLDMLFDMYVMGSGLGGGESKLLAFSILIPIGYLLLLCAFVLLFARYAYSTHLLCAISLLGVGILGLQGIASPNLELLSIGLLGVVTGYFPLQKIDAAVQHPYFLGLAYLLYLAAITYWNILFPLQIVGVFLSLAIIYSLGQDRGKRGALKRCIDLLGKYSLFGYIAQIAILQVLRRAANYLPSVELALALSFLLAFVLTITSVEIMDRMRAGSLVIDKAYKAVFA